VSLHVLFGHRPLELQDTLFVDTVSGKAVRKATCTCGIEWMTDGSPWFGFKMRRKDLKPFFFKGQGCV